MVSFEWSPKNFCLAMAVPTGPASTPLLIIVKNIGIDFVQTRMKFLNSACDFLEFQTGTFLSPNLLFLCLTTTYIEYVIRHCHKIPPCKRI